MSDQRPDDETLGRALGRAVESQSVRETPFAASPLAHRIDRPDKRGWTYALPAVAALALFVAVGAFFAGRGPQGGVATPNASDAPIASTPAATFAVPPAGSASPLPSISPTPTLVYFGRDGLPPVGARVMGSWVAATDAVGQISARLTALVSAGGGDVPSGAINAARLTAEQVRTMSIGVRIDGDLATVAIGIDGGWPARGAAQSQALLQQLVYTITEQPGIRGAKITDKGGSPATIDQLVVDQPLTREDVAGYSVPAERSLTIDDEQRPVTATMTVSNEVVAPALGRLTIELRPITPIQGAFWSPPLKAELLPTTPGSGAKWALSVTLPGITDPRAGSLVGAGPLQELDGTPIRSLRVRREANGVTYELYLDDARPWRIALQRGADGAMRVLVDVGGQPSRVTNNTAVYAVQAGPGTQAGLGVFGVARAFEATVNWRVRDRTGREVAKGFTNASVGTSPYYGTFEFLVPMPSSLDGATLEVYQASPRDGSDTNKVTVPLGVP